MDDFADTLLSSFKLKRKDCLPTSDTSYRIKYGMSYSSPFRLEVAFNPNKLIIRSLFINPRFQGQGLGRTIVEYLKRECVRLGMREIELDSVLDESIGFWERCGFSLNGKYGRWEVHEP